MNRDGGAGVLPGAELFRTIVEAAHEGIWMIDRDGRTTYANWRMGELLGYSVEEMRGRLHTDFMFEADRPAGDSEMELRRAGTRKQWDQRYRRKDGSELWTTASCCALFDDRGEVAGALGMFTDITARREAEEAFRRGEELFRSTFENAAVGMAHLGLEGRWRRVNATLCRLLGYSREELLGMTFQQLTHPEDLDEDLGEVRRILAGEIETYELEKRYRRKDGTHVWAHLTVALLRGAAGEPQEFVSVIQDISHRKRTEEELLQQRTAYEKLAENSPDIIARFDRAGRHLYVNHAALAATGRPAAWFIGKTNAELGMPASSCRQWQDALDRVFETARPMRLEFEFAHDGVRKHFESICVPEFAEAGQVVSVLSIARDVTALKHALAEARRGEQRANLAIEAATLGLFEWDLSTSELTWQNARMFEIFGRTGVVGARTGGEALRELVHPDDRAAFAAAFMELPTGGGVWHRVCRIVRANDGMLRHVEFAARLESDEAGCPLRLLGVVADITDRREAERARQESEQRLLDAARAKDDFFATLSHELRTPLNPVLLIASEAAENTALPAEVREDFKAIAKNALQEARLIDDLLDITRISRGKIALDMRMVELGAVVDDAISNVRPDAEAKGLSLELVAATEPQPVLGDANRLLQVFSNVVKNAIKFTPAGRGIRVAVTADRAAGEAVVTCTDEGIGMSRAELARIFDAFAQGDHADGGGSPAYGGLGLGLAISRMLVGLHSGDIRADSDGPGHGSTFTIRLPLMAVRDPSAARVGAPEAPQPVGTGVQVSQILLVEDHEPTRKALAQLLERRGHAVTGVGSVDAALRAADQREFDFVISDLGLPDGDGCELMAALRERHGLHGVALTGYGRPDDLARSHAAGFVTHLTKPVTIGSLEAALAHVRPE